MKQTIILAGGSGLIGDAIVRSFGDSANLIILSRTEKKGTANVSYAKWNPKQGEIDQSILERADIVINLAGESVNQRWTKAAKAGIMDSRVHATRTLVDRLNRCTAPKIFISASAIGIYPDTQQWVLEDTKVGDSFLAEVCIAWEREAKKLNTTHTLIIPRIGMVLSSKGGALDKLTPLFKLGFGSPIGTGQQWQSWIHIEDLARMFVYLAASPKAGIYNAVAPEPVTNKIFGASLAKALKRWYILPAVPAFVLRFVLGEMSVIALASNRVGSDKIRQQGFDYNYSDIDSALQSIYRK
ncbi:MAG: TIGR01777 family protein [Cryomorphaceae bacterium]|nr:TIGR01777 family protein [Cryomorphaceae bacterium]